MLKAIFFDIDNTLLSFDAFVREAMRDGFARYGLKPFDEGMLPVFHSTNSALWEALERQEIDHDDILRVRWNRIFEKLGIDFDGATFEDYFSKQLFSSAIVIDGAMDLLDYLHGKYTLAVASNGPFPQQQNRLRVAGLRPYFQHVFISGDIGAAKPAKAFFDGCFRRLPLAPGEVLMVGDSLTSDMRGAKAYGLRTCFYNPSGRPASADCDYVVRSLSEIRELVQTANIEG